MLIKSFYGTSAALIAKLLSTQTDSNACVLWRRRLTYLGESLEAGDGNIFIISHDTVPDSYISPTHPYSLNLDADR